MILVSYRSLFKITPSNVSSLGAQISGSKAM
jgi:hypothetical protein